MFLETPGLPFKKERFKAHSFFDDPVADEVLGYQKPSHLVALKDSMWPEEVVEKIAQQFKAIGLQDPRRQKLVEPYAVAFGGMNVEGRPISQTSIGRWSLTISFGRRPFMMKTANCQ